MCFIFGFISTGDTILLQLDINVFVLHHTTSTRFADAFVNWICLEKVAQEGCVDDTDAYDIAYDSRKYCSSIITIALMYGIMFVNTK